MAKRLSLPLRVSPLGGLAAIDVDSTADVVQSVALALSTTLGERRSVPDYGIGDLLGASFDLDEIAEAVSRCEERAQPTHIEVAVSSLTEPRVSVYPSSPATVEGEE